MTNKWSRQLFPFLRGWGFSLIIVFLIVTSFRSAIADWNDVPSGSMKPTILEGDRIFVNKLAYDLKVPFSSWQIASWGDPDRGDIVVFFSPEDGKRLVKRVVGLPGDMIHMRAKKLYINGVAAEYEPLDRKIIDQLSHDQQSFHLFYSENIDEEKHPVMVMPSISSIQSFGPVKIPEKRYFMLGDNRDHSADSRFFGFVDRSTIVGRVTTVVLSLKWNEKYLPRWDRFFYRLP